jgi:hypothetical protein
MMVSSNRYDALAEFKKLPVVGLRWGDLLDLAPAVRRSVGTGLLLEEIPRKKKAMKPKAIEPVLDVTTVTQSNKAIEKPCRNLFTTVMIKGGNSTYKIEKTMIDAGSVVNLALQSLLDKIGVTLHPVRNVAIRMATSALMEIKYCAGITVFVGNISTTVMVYAIPQEFNLLYGLLLSRGWLKAVKESGNYEIDSYHIRDPDGNFYEVLRNNGMQARVITVEIPIITTTRDIIEDDSSDKEDGEDCQSGESSTGSEGDDILLCVIGQASKEMRRKGRSKNGGGGSDWSSGNGEDL